MTETLLPNHVTQPPGRPLILAFLAFYKVSRGAFEILVGTFMLFSQEILSEAVAKDPQNTLASWLFANLGVEQSHKLGIFLILLGVTSLIIGMGIWYGSWFLRKVAIVLLGATVAFGIYDIVSSLSMVKFGELIMNIFLIWYFWNVLPKYLHAESDVKL